MGEAIVGYPIICFGNIYLGSGFVQKKLIVEQGVLRHIVTGIIKGDIIAQAKQVFLKLQTYFT